MMLSAPHQAHPEHAAAAAQADARDAVVTDIGQRRGRKPIADRHEPQDSGNR